MAPRSRSPTIEPTATANARLRPVDSSQLHSAIGASLMTDMRPMTAPIVGLSRYRQTRTYSIGKKAAAFATASCSPIACESRNVSTIATTPTRKIKYPTVPSRAVQQAMTQSAIPQSTAASGRQSTAIGGGDRSGEESGNDQDLPVSLLETIEPVPGVQPLAGGAICGRIDERIQEVAGGIKINQISPGECERRAKREDE